MIVFLLCCCFFNVFVNVLCFLGCCWCVVVVIVDLANSNMESNHEK